MTNVAASGPANFSIAAALAAGILSNNAQVSTIAGVAVSKSYPNPTVSSLLAAGLLNPAMPASTIGFAGYGGS